VTARSVNIGRIARTAALFTVVLALLGQLGGFADPPSVLFGGAFSIANLHLIRVLVSRLMSPDSAGPRMGSVVSTKLLLLLAVLAVALKRLPIDAASFLFGGGSVLVAIVLDAVWLGEPVQETDDDAGRA
jgi:multidrug transporter EmrE-like cation transporter